MTNIDMIDHDAAVIYAAGMKIACATSKYAIKGLLRVQ